MSRQVNLKFSTEVMIKDYLDLYQDRNQAVSDAFNRVIARLNLYKKNKGISSFVITGCQPLAGTTTFAIDLSITMALSGWKTIFIDADLRKGPDQKSYFGLSNYLKSGAPLEKIIHQSNLENLSYISNGSQAEETLKPMYSPKIDTLIEYLRERFDMILFDMPSINVYADASILASIADATILIAKQGVTKKTQIINAKRELTYLGANLLGIVMNQVDKSAYNDFYGVL